MIIHPMVTQLHFARSEFKRGLEGVSEPDGCIRLQQMNSLSWIVGHLTNQENRYWVKLAQNLDMETGLNDLVGYGKPPSMPPLAEMWVAWSMVTTAADRYLEALRPEQLSSNFLRNGKPVPENVGILLLRNIYHYWYHLGEACAVRQLLGHSGLAEFVGDMSAVEFEHH
jgi:hypothetical protein